MVLVWSHRRVLQGWEVVKAFGDSSISPVPSLLGAKHPRVPHEGDAEAHPAREPRQHRGSLLTPAGVGAGQGVLEPGWGQAGACWSPLEPWPSAAVGWGSQQQQAASLPVTRAPKLLTSCLKEKAEIFAPVCKNLPKSSASQTALLSLGICRVLANCRG